MNQRSDSVYTAPRFWGFDAFDLHDRCWSAFGVQVVRRNGPPVVQKGPQFYLLLEPDDLVLTNLKPLIQQFNWLKPSAIRIRITDSRGEGYNEIINADPQGNLISVSRDYEKKTRRTIRAWLTPNHQLAKIWRDAASCRAGRIAVRDAADPNHVLVVGRPGRIFDPLSAHDVDDCYTIMQQHWRNPSATIDGIYQYEENVWIHESVRVPEDVRLIAPLWIGANTTFFENEILIGPGGRPDQQHQLATKPPPIPWDELQHANWRFNVRQRSPKIHRLTKRLFDIAFASAAILATLPIYPIVIALILIEDGWAPFFTHRRQTLRGKEFPCLKFRTMRRDAEDMKGQLQAENQADGPQFFMEEDPRLLKCGGILRKLQIDELPQFWNVLLGHMSIVGPRPSPEKENQYCPTWREARLSVRPGITGLWQVRRTRRPQTDFQEWIRYDLEYIQNQNWHLDLWIIWQTVKRIFKG